MANDYQKVCGIALQRAAVGFSPRSAQRPIRAGQTQRPLQ